LNQTWLASFFNELLSFWGFIDDDDDAAAYAATPDIISTRE